MSLRDEHLLKALEHAPDSDTAPADVTRKTVLDYADKALKSHSESWFTRLINAFNAWQLPRWQLAGMGSLAASLLVVVMIWHENPDDPMQVATAPTEISEATPMAETKPEPESEPKLAQAESASDDLNQAAPIANELFAASAEIAAPKAKENVLTKDKPIKKESDTAPQVSAVEQAASIEAPSDKTIVASAPEAPPAQSAAEDTGSTQAKTRTASNEAAAMPAPVAAAPAASAEASADAASGQVADKSMKKMAEAETQSEAKSESSRAVAAAKPAMTSSNALAQAISKEGGKTVANRDIQVGRLRILDLSKQAARVDDETGYRIEFIADDSGTLAAEVAAYNQTMRDWYLNQNK